MSGARHRTGPRQPCPGSDAGHAPLIAPFPCKLRWWTSPPRPSRAS